MRFSELSGKQVINIKTGAVLGKVCDLEFLEKNYEIKDFFACQPPNMVKRCFPWFFPPQEVRIRTCDIINIGEDVILVQIS